MGIWTEYTGEVVSSLDKHFSFEKAIKEYFDGHDFTYRTTSHNMREDRVVYVNFYFNIEWDIEESTKMFCKFLDKINDKIIYIDVKVKGRLLR